MMTWPCVNYIWLNITRSCVEEEKKTCISLINILEVRWLSYLGDDRGRVSTIKKKTCQLVLREKVPLLYRLPKNFSSEPFLSVQLLHLEFYPPPRSSLLFVLGSIMVVCSCFIFYLGFSEGKAGQHGAYAQLPMPHSGARGSDVRNLFWAAALSSSIFGLGSPLCAPFLQVLMQTLLRGSGIDVHDPATEIVVHGVNSLCP